MKTVEIFYRPDNKEAPAWAKKIARFIEESHKNWKIVDKGGDVVIVLGGDGTILEATRIYQKQKPIILGLNLGHVGFLASVRDPKDFLAGLDKFFSGKYKISPRMMMSAKIIRGGKAIFETKSLNDVSVENISGLVEISVRIEGQEVQYIRGTGVLVSTATGSTAYNLSAHGPIVMPDIKCFILSEVMDHNIPTPSIVIKRNREIHLKVMDFREKSIFSLTATGEKCDVIFRADGENFCVLKKGDEIVIKRSPTLIRFAELEDTYFFKSLHEKFDFR